MLQLLPNKKIVAGLLCALAVFSFQPLHAKSCSRQSFSIKTSEKLAISDVISELASKCNFSVVTKDVEANKILEKQLSGLNIKDMSLKEVLNLILSENGINYSYKRGILKLSSLATKTFKLDYITSVRTGNANISASSSAQISESGSNKQGQDKSNNEIKVEEKFDFWKTLETEVTAILNNGSESFKAQKPIINKNTGLITVTATKPQLDRVDAYLKQLKHRLHKQVMIDVSVIEVALGNRYKTGIDWSKFQLSINTKNGTTTGGANATFLNTLNNTSKNLNIINNLNFSMEGVVDFIKGKGNSRIVSNPKIMTMNNQQALITIGDNISYKLQKSTIEDGKTNSSEEQYTVFTGVLLNILPEVSDDNKIMLRINPSLSTPTTDIDPNKPLTIAPNIKEKKLSTVVQVNSGDTIILGGLIDEKLTKDKTSVPVLGDLPILGKAFRSTSNTTQTTELVFVITPRIVDLNNATPISQSLKELGFSESLYE